MKKPAEVWAGVTVVLRSPANLLTNGLGLRQIGSDHMEGEPPLGDLGQAFMSYAESCSKRDDLLLQRAQYLEGRVLALELVVRALSRSGAAHSDLRSTVLQTLDAEFSDRVGSASSHVDVAAAFISALQELLPEREAKLLKLKH